MTVSMAAETIGMLIVMLRVMRVPKRDVARQDRGVGRNEQNVVERERLGDGSHGGQQTQSGIIRAPPAPVKRPAARHPGD